MSEPVGPRVRVTGPPRPRQTAQRPVDLRAESPLSEVYLDSLLAAQLRLAGRILLLLGLAVGSLPLVFFVLPGLAEVQLARVPLPWLVLGLGVYPVLVLLGGLLLAFPGFLSDILGLLLVLPFTRPLARSWFRSVVGRRMPPGVVPGQPPPGPVPRRDDDIIEGEVLDEQPPPEESR